MNNNKSGDFDFSKLREVPPESVEAKLFCLIDDMDTASDMLKPPQNNFYNYVMKKVKQAQEYIVSDGYKLYYKKQPFKTAWESGEIMSSEKIRQLLDDLISVQKQSLSNDYMRGFCNGLICAKASLLKEEPDYID